MISLEIFNYALTHGDLTPVFADNNILAFIRRSTKQTLLIIINTNFEKTEKFLKPHPKHSY
jgi:hypothetical protein